MSNNLSTIIEITEYQIRLFRYATVRGKRLLSCCDLGSLGQNKDQDIAKFLKKNNFLKGIPSEEMAFVVPRKSVILKQLKLPTHNESELNKMLSLQLGSQIPYAMDDVIYDYSILDQEPSGYTQVLVTVIHKDVSARYLKSLMKAKVSPGKMILSSWGVLGWFSFQNHQKQGIKERNAIVVNITSCHTEICFCANEKLYFSRSLNFGVKEFTEKKFSFFIKQLKLSVDAYNKGEMGPSMENIIILGSHRSLLSLKKQMETEMRLPVRLFSSFENIVCTKNVSLSTLTHQQGASFAVCLGFLFSDAEKRGNLIPKEVSEIKDQKLLDIERVKFVLLVILACFLMLTIVKVERKALLNLEGNIDKKKAEILPLVKKMKKKEMIVKELTAAFQGRFYVPEIVYAIHKIVPEGLILNSLSIDKQGNVTIAGDALSSALVQTFQQQLVEEKDFYDVRLQYATKRKLYRKEVTNYKIVLKVLNTINKDF